jgi:hypothetical protein
MTHSPLVIAGTLTTTVLFAAIVLCVLFVWSD